LERAPLFRLAIHEGPGLERNGGTSQADKKRTRRLTPDEYRVFGAAAEQAGAAWQAVAGARLIALTALRRGEIVNLKWAEVDEAGGCFRLADSKEGPSVRPIGRAAFDLLATLPRSGPYVLPAVRGSGPFGGLPGAFKKIAERAGLPDLTPHVLRHSFASTAGDLDYSEPTIAAMLGHASGSVTTRYIHHLDSVLIAAASRVAARVDAAMNGAGAVVEFRRPAG
jgi:integrase